LLGFQLDFLILFDYLPLSEMENSEGYTDIYLKRGNCYPQLKYEWIWEIKYVKTSFWKRASEIKKKQKESIAQLRRYKNSNLFKDRTDVRYLSVVFGGKKEYLLKEVE
jgi:hypothetical protein